MIEPNIYHRLGIKTLWIMILERMFGPLISFFGILVLIVARAADDQFLTSSFSASIETVGKINAVIDLFILGFIFLWLLVVILNILVAWVGYHFCSFCLNDNALEVRKGFLHKVELSIPYRQIENVDMEQGLIGQSLGVCKLIILTAGHEDDKSEKDGGDGGESEGVLPMLDKDFADDLKKELLARSSLDFHQTTPTNTVTETAK
ncbi:MAG: PH domain-containing protein [Candidatus Pacebacteria bacterium]|nr:PH domain-containing protein [Candidatus Paceibacterota bacterium]